MKLKHWIGLAGFACLVGGVAWIYQPAGLLVAGVILIKAFTQMDKDDDARPNR